MGLLSPLPSIDEIEPHQPYPPALIFHCPDPTCTTWSYACEQANTIHRVKPSFRKHWLEEHLYRQCPLFDSGDPEQQRLC